MITATGNRAGICGRTAATTAGFTLIEMIAVIVLIAIAVTVAAVSLHGRGRSQLDATAQRVAAGLRHTRVRAMATGKPQWFTVNLRARTYAAPGDDPRHFPSGVTVHVTSAAQDTTQTGIARVRYFPNGSSSGGHVDLSRSHHAVRINVDWLTGGVGVDKHSHAGAQAGASGG